jgi:stearoyl-CoA desaturase (delta-9 desaturase)
LWIGGEELHNNHHAYPTSARLAYRRGEIDLGWFVICLLKKLRLVKVLRVARPPKLSDRPRSLPDILEALCVYRLQVLRWFEKAWLQELNKLSLPEVQKSAMRRHPLDARLHLPGTAVSLQALQEKWQSLQALWSDPSLSQDECLQRLGAWLAQARQSSCEALRHLAWKLERLA